MKSNLFANRTLGHILKIAVLPEIEKRLTSGQLTQDKLPMVLHRFRLVQKRLPNNSVEPIVELNEEVKVTVETIARGNLQAGQPVTLQDIDPNHIFIRPPVIDGKQQGYFLWIGTLSGHFSFFDFLRNTQGFVEGSSANIPYPVKDFLHLKDYIEKVKPQEQLKILADNNWPPAPGYFPTTLLAISNHSSAVSDPTFVNTVSHSFSPEFWDERLEFWKGTIFFLEDFIILNVQSAPISSMILSLRSMSFCLNLKAS